MVGENEVGKWELLNQNFWVDETGSRKRCPVFVSKKCDYALSDKDIWAFLFRCFPVTINTVFRVEFFKLLSIAIVACGIGQTEAFSIRHISNESPYLELIKWEPRFLHDILYLPVSSRINSWNYGDYLCGVATFEKFKSLNVFSASAPFFTTTKLESVVYTAKASRNAHTDSNIISRVNASIFYVESESRGPYISSPRRISTYARQKNMRPISSDGFFHDGNGFFSENNLPNNSGDT